MVITKARRVTALASLLALGSCGSPSEPDRVDAVPAQLEKQSGDNQSGAPFVALPEPLVVRVTNEVGKPVSGVVVSFVPAGGDLLEATSDTTDPAGLAETRVVPGPLEGSRPVTVTAATLTTTFSLTVAASQLGSTTSTVGAPGGTVVVQLPGAESLSVMVPAGAFGGTVTAHAALATVPAALVQAGAQPVAPLITLDLGGQAPDSLIRIRVPAPLRTGQYRAAYQLRPSDGRLVPLPMLASDSQSVTFGAWGSLKPPNLGSLRRPGAGGQLSTTATFVVTATPPPTGLLDSGFRPGVDDWESANYGSALSPGGFCLGQTLSMAWYYDQRRLGQGQAKLWQRYDRMAVPGGLDYDNRAFRLNSMVQEDNSGFFTTLMSLLKSSTDQAAWDQLVSVISATKRPTEIGVFGSQGGHSVLAYQVDPVSGLIRIADPNHPGDHSRVIRYNLGTKTFSPYTGGQRADGSSIVYDEIRYVPASIYDWTLIGTRWDEFEAGTVGVSDFPAASIYVASGGGHTALQSAHSTPATTLALDTDAGFQLEVFDAAGQFLNSGSTVNLPLKHGSQTFGVLLLDANGDAVDFLVSSVTATQLPALEITQQPVDGYVGLTFQSAVRARVRDLDGTTLTSPQYTIAIGLGANPVGAVLSGPSSVSTVQGVATFAGLTMDRSGMGFTVIVSAAGLQSAETVPFLMRSDVLGLRPDSVMIVTGEQVLLEVPGVAVQWALAGGAGTTLTTQVPFASGASYTALVTPNASGVSTVTAVSGSEFSATKLFAISAGSLGIPAPLTPADRSVFSFFPRDLTLTWSPLSGANHYEVDIQGCSAFSWTEPTWWSTCTYWFNAAFSGRFLQAQQATLNWQFVGAQPGRWRVRAVDSQGRPGRFSGWFSFKWTM